MYLGKELNKLDSLGNKYRKRILLINTEDNLKIDNESLNLYKIVLNNFDNKDSDTEFFQVSVIFQRDNNEGRNKKQFIIKKIEEIVDIIQLDIINNKELLNNFLNDMNIIIKKDTFFLSIDNLKRKYKLIFDEVLPELNGDNEYINYLCVYNNLTDINQFYIFYLAQFFFKNQIILNNQILLQSIIKKIEEDYKNIELDKIKIPEKIKIISTFFSIYNDCEEISHLKALKIKYFLFSERQKNSIMDKVYIFFEKFIELLSEESKIFFYLLQVNSGTGFCQKERVYTFDLSNLNMVKQHLKTIFPESLTIYNFYESKEHPGRAFCVTSTGGIALNEIFLLPSDKYDKNIDYNSNNQNISENDSDDISMNIVLYLFHEFLGHKKFHNSEKGTLSPKKIAKDNKLFKLKSENESYKKETNCEYILLSESNKGDSGHFLEICYNKFNNETIFKLLLSLDNKGKLIKRPDLFVSSNNLLEKWVILRTIAKEKNIQFKFEDNMTIEEEIENMNKIIDIEKYKEEQKEKENIKGKKHGAFNKYTKKSIGGNKKNFFISERKDMEKDKESYKEEKIDNLKEEESNIDEEINEEENDEKEEEEEESNEEYQKIKMILKKFNLKYDEELYINIKKKIEQTDLSEEDRKELDYVYYKFLNLY